MSRKPAPQPRKLKPVFSAKREPKPMTFKINVFHHYPETQDGDVRCLLERIIKNQESLMASATTFNELLSQGNVATNKLAENFAALIAKLNAGGMSAEEEEAVQESLRAHIKALEDFAASTSNPIPPIPSVPA